MLIRDGRAGASSQEEDETAGWVRMKYLYTLTHREKEPIWQARHVCFSADLQRSRFTSRPPHKEEALDCKVARLFLSRADAEH